MGLGAGVLAALGAIAFLVVRVLEAWRSLKRLRRHLGRALERLEDAGKRTSESAARAGEQEELAASVARLRLSLARLAVLRGALDEATDTVGRFTAVYPRK